MILLSIQWLAETGWSYMVFRFGPNPGAPESTALPREKGPVSDLVPDIDPFTPQLTDDERIAIKATAMQQWPDVKVEFGPAPRSATGPG